MKTKIFCIPFLFVSFLSFSQCIEQQTLVSGSQGAKTGLSFGQQFIACETGVIDKIELYALTGSSTTMKLEIYDSSSGWLNPMWEVDNISLNNVGPIIIDLTTGTGTTLNVIQNQGYSMRFWNTGSPLYSLGTNMSSADSYPSGAALDHFGQVQNFDPFFLDYYFRIAFNGAILSIQEFEFNKDDIIAYPNPANDLLNISIETDANYSLVNLNGQVLQQGKLFNGDNTVDISIYSSGLYFVKVETANGTKNLKLIKQ